jgi:kynureninase
MFERAAFRAEYSSFLGRHPDRVLLTGHSHQAWPDAARAAMTRAFDDAARFVDEKWGEAVFPLVDAVGRRVLTRLGFPEGDAIAFGESTHTLVFRLLSCFPNDARVVSTTSEFHSLYRQLRRLQEDGLRVTWVDASSREGLADRLLAAARAGSDLFMLSAVLFEDAHVVPRLGEIVEAAVASGATVLVDAYHAFNVVPLSWGPARDKLFVTAGGYKYAQFGEGVCFLRFPADTPLRPRSTGWFADFGSLESPRGAVSERVGYGEKGARFSGATFDPTAFYRADAALEVFDRHGLGTAELRAISSEQTGHIVARLSECGIPLLSATDPARRGGFVAVRVVDAHALVGRLRERGVCVDARGDALRLGPAPYLDPAEIDRALDVLIELMKRP